MRLLGKARNKVVEQAAYWLAGKYSVDLEKGKFGPGAQKLYIATKGKKTAIFCGLFLIASAIDAFAPPWADQGLFVAKLVTGAFAALFAVEKAYRSEPVFEDWMLDAFAWIAKNVAIAQTAVATAMPFVPEFFPNDFIVETWAGRVQLWTAAAAAACTFVNRLVVANKDVPPKAASVTEGQPALP